MRQQQRSPSSSCDSRTFVRLLAFVVLTDRLLVCSATFRIYIGENRLQNYFQGSEDLDVINGYMVDILSEGNSHVLDNGFLQLTRENDPVPFSGSGSGSGSGMGLSTLNLTGISLPPFPAGLDEIAISWFSSTEVTYRLTVEGRPPNHFTEIHSNASGSGSIPQEEASGFSLHFPCDPSADGEGLVIVNLTTTIVSSNQTTMISFHFDRDCRAQLVTTTTVPSFQNLPSSHIGTLIPTSSLSDAATVQFTPVIPTTLTVDLTTTVPPQLESSPPYSLQPSTNVIVPTPSISEEEPLMPFSSSLVEDIVTPTSSLLPSSPSPLPSLRPSSPTPLPSLLPSSPTPLPSLLPSSPTPLPSLLPSPPTPLPSLLPSSPTPLPSLRPSPPTPLPSLLPSSPTPLPSLLPSSPTPLPSLLPSPPTPLPSLLPSSPTPLPSLLPSSPTPLPSLLPSPPTPLPSLLPSSPTPLPSLLPSSPTPLPSLLPSSPTPLPSLLPSSPTPLPSLLPSSPTPLLSLLPSSSMPPPTPSISPSPSSIMASSLQPDVSRSVVEVTSSQLAMTQSPLPTVIPTTVTTPTVVITMTTTEPATTLPPTVRENAISVTLSGLTAEMFDEDQQLMFRVETANAVNEYCRGNPSDCVSINVPRAKRQGGSVQADDIVLTDIRNQGTNGVAFSMHTQSGGGVLSQHALQQAVEDNVDGYAAAQFNVINVEPLVPATTATSTTQLSEPPILEFLIVAFAPVVVVLVISIIIICLSICICLCCKKKKRRYFSDDPADIPVNMTPDNYLYPTAYEMEVKKDETPISLWMHLSWGSVSNLPAGIQGVIKRHSVDRRALGILATVSRGDYGCIVNGQMNLDHDASVEGSRGVMLKMYIGFQKQYGHRDEITKFLEGAMLLRGMDHPNIHTVLKITMEDNYIPIVVYPVMEYGNLHQFLTLCRVTPDDSSLSVITLQHKVSFSYQIISGMTFLSDKGVVHPDLALRNCCLDTNYQVKVSDGALSQCFYPECYHVMRGTVRPVRWSALETLQEGLCSSRSNVWSCAVTLWEVMTLGRLPYCDDVDHNRGVLTHLLMQSRLGQPVGCPDNIYSLMLNCWKTHAEERPNFNELYDIMYDIHHKYEAMVNLAPPTSQGIHDTSYSTFGKDLRSRDSYIMEVASLSSAGNSYNRRKKSVGSMNRGSLSRGSPMTSRRSSQLRDSMSVGGERLSLTFSVLSNDNDLNSSCSEGEELERGLGFEIPSFLTGQGDLENNLYPKTESPMELVSTFLPPSPCHARIFHDHTDNPSSFLPPNSSHSSSAPAPPIRTTSPAPPTRLTITQSSETTSFSSSQLEEGGHHSNGDIQETPSSFSGTVDETTHHYPLQSSVSFTPSNPDTISKPPSPDTIPGFVSGSHSTEPSSHIPGLPNSTYNSTSVSIDDVQLRTKLVTSTNDQSTKFVSSTPSAASKSDSGIRSDEEVESMLSNGGTSEGKMSTKGNKSPEIHMDVGVSTLSSDLMATLASW